MPAGLTQTKTPTFSGENASEQEARASVPIQSERKRLSDSRERSPRLSVPVGLPARG
jgi:hypothetical protein